MHPGVPDEQENTGDVLRTRTSPGKDAGSGRVDLDMVIQVRRIAPDDADLLRRVRLAALADAPGSFWQILADECARPQTDWEARARRGAAGAAGATFLLEQDSQPMGMVDAHQPSVVPDFRDLAAMWVAPSLRGSGAADALLGAAVAWSRSVEAIGVRLWVVPTNTAAVRLYLRHGFRRIGGPVPDGGDSAGKVYIPMVHALDHTAAGSPSFLERARAPWSAGSG